MPTGCVYTASILSLQDYFFSKNLDLLHLDFKRPNSIEKVKENSMSFAGERNTNRSKIASHKNSDPSF